MQSIDHDHGVPVFSAPNLWVSRGQAFGKTQSFKLQEGDYVTVSCDFSVPQQGRNGTIGKTNIAMSADCLSLVFDCL